MPTSCILKLTLFFLASSVRLSAIRRVWDLQSTRAMSTSTYYEYQHVVWHFVGLAFAAEMERQRRRQTAAMDMHGDDVTSRRMVLSADPPSRVCGPGRTHAHR